MSTTKTKPAQHTVHRVNLKGFIEEQGGKLIGIDFVKKDGCPRKLTGRLGVDAHLVGGVHYLGACSRPHITMFDMVNAGYRSVNLATVSAVRANGREYAVVG